MRVNKQQLAGYLGKHPTRVKKDYQAYLDVLEITDRTYITVFDVAKIDDLHPFDVAFLMHFPKPFIAKLSELKHYEANK